ncbi:fibronectin type III domain-containing protein [Streptomyces sp. NPDC127066]|uniref:fibronectin type III domain-containing protein n=1 Tax=Streptomyces sp. NPDC127066 TaxID=3347125 RepID=UPI0036607E71
MRRPGRAIALFLAAASVLVSGPSALAAVPAAPTSGKTIVDQGGNSVQLSARTTVLDQATVAAVASVTKKAVTFVRNTPQIAALGAGDIVVNQAVASTPLMVTSVTRTGERTTLAVREATTTEAYAQVKLHKQVKATRIASVSGTALTADGGETPGGTTNLEVTSSQTVVKWKATIASDKFTKKGPTGAKVTGVIETNGEVRYEPTLDVDFDLAARKFSVKSSVKPTIKFDLTSNVELEIGKDWAKPFRLGQATFAPVVFTVGPIPFTVRPELEVGFGLSGKVSAGLGMKFDCSASSSTTGGTPPELKADLSVGSTTSANFSYNGCPGNVVKPTFNAMGTVEAKVPLTLFTKFDELAGPYVRVTGSVYATADSSKKPWLDWGIKVTGEVGGRVEAGGWKAEASLPAATLWQWPKKPTTTTAFKGVSSVTTTYNHATTTGAAKTFNYPGELLTLKANVAGGATKKNVKWSQTPQSKYDLWFVNPACTTKKIETTKMVPTSGVCARRTSWTGETVKAYTYRDPALSAATPATSKNGIFTQGQFAYSVTTTDSGVSAPHTGSVSVLRTAPVKPTAATKLTGTALEAGARLTWAAPADDGGTPVTRYRVYATTTANVAKDRKTVEQMVYGTTVDLNRLAEKVPYTITVTPLNRIGYGPAVTTTVTPLAPIRASGLIKVAPASYTDGLDHSNYVSGNFSNAAFSSDGRYLLAYSDDRTEVPGKGSVHTLVRVDLTTGARVEVPQVNSFLGDPLSASNDGSRVFDGHHVHDFSTGQTTTLVPEDVGLTNWTLSGNGQVAFWTAKDDPLHVKMVRLASPTKTTALAVAVTSYGQLVDGTIVGTLSASGDGTRLLVRNTRTATDDKMPTQAGVVIETGTGTRQTVTPTASDFGRNVQQLALSANGRFVTFELNDKSGKYLQYIVDLQQTSPRIARSLSAPAVMLREYETGLEGTVVSNDGRVAAWTTTRGSDPSDPSGFSGYVSFAGGCDRLTQSCAVATTSRRADGQSEWGRAYFVNDCHTAFWVTPDGTVYRKDLTW